MKATNFETIKRAVFFGLLIAITSAHADMVALQNHVPTQKIAEANHIGRLDANQKLSLNVALELRNQKALEDLIVRLNDRNDPQYGHFLSQTEFVKNFAPTADDVASVVSYFENQGLRVTKTYPTLINVEGSVADVEQAFQLEMHQYRSFGPNLSARTNFSASSAPLVDDAIAGKIRSVVGLDDFSSHRPHLHLRDNVSASLVGTGPGGGLSPSDINKAYSLNVTSTSGAGRTLALFELDGYAAGDIAQYATQFGITSPPPLQNILVDGFSGAAGAGAVEVCLDIELMMAVAPGAKKILVYEGPNSDAGVVDTYARIANDNIAKEISTSWGAAESATTTSIQNAENAIFMQMAAQGQSIFAAAGDAGAYDDGSTLSVDDPASQPYMTAVGGTRLSLNADGSYKSETTWGNAGNRGGGGGGISSFWTIPNWQTGLATTANKGSQTKRMVPDVSLASDPASGYAIYSGGQWGVVGGTSAAAPLWAAFAALVNQKRAMASAAPLGFANPLLYAIAGSDAYATAFHDIKDASTNLFYPAVTNYDLGTGLGSFNGGALLLNLIPPPAPTNLTVVETP